MTLANKDIKQLIDTLKGLEPQEFRINSALGSREAENFSFELSNVLSQAGWKAGVDRGFADIVINPAFKGIIISFPAGEIPKGVRELEDWLKQNEFNVVVTQEYKGSYNEIMVLP